MTLSSAGHELKKDRTPTRRPSLSPGSPAQAERGRWPEER
jgi:hypothetical protein